MRTRQRTTDKITWNNWISIPLNQIQIRPQHWTFNHFGFVMNLVFFRLSAKSCNIMLSQVFGVKIWSDVQYSRTYVSKQSEWRRKSKRKNWLTRHDTLCAAYIAQQSDKTASFFHAYKYSYEFLSGHTLLLSIPGRHKILPTFLRTHTKKSLKNSEMTKLQIFRSKFLFIDLLKFCHYLNLVHSIRS